MSKPIILPDTFAGTGDEDWRDWLSAFDVVSEINNWTEAVRCKFLGLRLKGHALKVFRDLDEPTKSNWGQLKTLLTERLGTTTNPELYKSQFLSKTRDVGEGVLSLGNTIRTLARKAYPTLDANTRDELARDQFIRALVTNQKLVLHLRHHLPKTLDDAMKMSIEWETIEKDVGGAGHSAANTCSTSLGAEMQGASAAGGSTQDLKVSINATSQESELLGVMREMLHMMKGSQIGPSNMGDGKSQPRRRMGQGGQGSYGQGPKCFNCGKLGHISRDCRAKKMPSGTCWNCGDPSHFRANCPHPKKPGNGR